MVRRAASRSPPSSSNKGKAVDLLTPSTLRKKPVILRRVLFGEGSMQLGSFPPLAADYAESFTLVVDSSPL
jgi:hypothetical protein